jgi:hypothetical protein
MHACLCEACPGAARSPLTAGVVWDSSATDGPLQGRRVRGIYPPAVVGGAFRLASRVLRWLTCPPRWAAPRNMHLVDRGVAPQAGSTLMGSHEPHQPVARPEPGREVDRAGEPEFTRPPCGPLCRALPRGEIRTPAPSACRAIGASAPWPRCPVPIFLFRRPTFRIPWPFGTCFIARSRIMWMP